MVIRRLSVIASVCTIAGIMVAAWSGAACAQTDSLTLQAPQNVYVVGEMQGDRAAFLNYVFWEDIDPAIGTFIHPADTNGWNPRTSNNLQEDLSVPISGGVYSGSIDRTVQFRALRSGVVGSTPDLRIRFEIIAEEQWNSVINPGAGYNAGAPIPCIFRNQNTQELLDLGITVQFTPGKIDSNGVFIIGVEDFEGFHMWRGIEPDGSDLTVIGELSKEETFAGISDVDLLYFSEIIPALRETGVYNFPFAVPGFGSSIDIRGIHPNGKLGPRELVWFDTNAFNGFTYQYLITTFDRGYNVLSHSQGLLKYDHCRVAQGVPISCPDELVSTTNQVLPQNTMREIYAVPNPYRTGSSQFTAPNYHNYPDNKIRFVNVPIDCEVRIYTPAGDLVRTLKNAGGTGVLEWDVRNRGGEEVSSGTYIYRVERNNGDSMYGRLTIIR